MDACPLLPFALLHAFRGAAAVLRDVGAATRWSTATSFTVTHRGTDTPWLLILDSDLTPPRRDPHCGYITWSGLVYPAAVPHLYAALRDRLSITFLNTAARWLSLPHTRHWPTPPPLLPGPSVLATDMATVLRWLLHIPADSLVGPWAAATGDLRPLTPRPPGPRPLLSCGTLYDGPHIAPISVLTEEPPCIHADHVVLRLPPGLLLVCNAGRLPVGLRRLLDALYPPPERYLLTDLWLPVDDPGEVPDPLPELQEPSSGSDSDSSTEPDELPAGGPGIASGYPLLTPLETL